jgi:hypothetical protein
VAVDKETGEVHLTGTAMLVQRYLEAIRVGLTR